MGMAPREVWDTPEAPGEGFWGHRALPCPSSPLKPPPAPSRALPAPLLSLPSRKRSQEGSRLLPTPQSLLSAPPLAHTGGSCGGETQPQLQRSPQKNCPGAPRAGQGAQRGCLGVPGHLLPSPGCSSSTGRGGQGQPQLPSASPQRGFQQPGRGASPWHSWDELLDRQQQEWGLC